MAAFTNITPPSNSYVQSQNIIQNTTYYNYYGTVTLKANNGYYFDSNETYVMYKPNDNASRVNGVIQSDNTVCIFTILSNNYRYNNLANAIVFDGVLASTVVPRELSVIQNLTNCTISGLPSTVTDQSTLNLTLTADTNCKFEAAPTLDFGTVVIDGDGNPQRNAVFTVASDQLTASLNINLSDWNLDYMATVETLTITATAQSSIKTVTITKNVTNCTTNAPNTIKETDTTINIIATAANGCQFDTPPTILFYDGNGVVLHGFTFAVLASKLSANVTFDVSTFDDFADVETIVLTATAVAIVETKELTQVLSNCTTNAPNTIKETDTVINITATANANCKFLTAPTLYIIDTNGNPNVFAFTISNDGLTAVLAFDVAAFGFNNIGNTCEITATAETITPYETKYGSINVYVLTENQLEQFSEKRFFIENLAAQGDTPQYDRIDLGNYVHTLKRIYCNVGNTVTDVLKCGNYNTNIAVATPLNDVITVDCGTVAIPQFSYNVNDYDTTAIQIFVPFVGFVNLSNDFIGKTIALQYVCNLITTETIVNVICDNIIINQIECELSNDIIYRTLVTQREFNTVGNVAFNSMVLKGLQPYVIVKHFTDLTQQAYNNENKRVTLNTLNGFARVTELTNFDVSNVSREIYNRVISVLNDGVIF